MLHTVCLFLPLSFVSEHLQNFSPIHYDDFFRIFNNDMDADKRFWVRILDLATWNFSNSKSSATCRVVKLICRTE